ncbi:MAG: hypothetical protein IIC51_09025 [Planctomycetes bacterium]|nr:hypothetical protein [Planctomycetota bacterium]
MAGLESIQRGLVAEDAAVERQYRNDENQIYGDSSTGGQPPRGQDMGGTVNIAGDVTIPPLPPPLPAPQKNGVVKYLAATIVGAGLVGGGIALADALLNPTPKVTIMEDTDTIGIFEPDK